MQVLGWDEAILVKGIHRDIDSKNVNNLKSLVLQTISVQIYRFVFIYIVQSSLHIVTEEDD